MPVYPGATYRPLNPAYLPGKPIPKVNRVNCHVQAGLGSLFGFFNAPKRASSHFWVAKSGYAEQYVDTSQRAEADLEGNDATISIETEGGTGTTADTEQWTQAQQDRLVDLIGWISKTHGVPVVWVENAYIGNSGSLGTGCHRHGIDGTFPALPDIRAGRLQRGNNSQMHYSLSRGKVCPGGGKIQQIPGILARINGSTPPPVIPPTPQPPQTGLVVDGSWGSATTTRLQQYLGTYVDGVISHQWKQPGINHPGLYSAQWDTTQKGSSVIRALQGKIGAEQDGLCGPGTITALQRYLGTPQDGKISTPVSEMVKALQRRLNANNL